MPEIDKRGVIPDIPTMLEILDSSIGKTSQEYEDARQYYENDQEPPDVPDNIDYLVDNLISDLINRLTGNIIGSEIEIVYIGAKQYKDALKVLTKSIFKETKLNSTALMQLINNFLIEGLAGVKFGYDPYKRSIFGLGSPVIYIDDPENVALDTAAVDRMHSDDVIRMRKKRITLQEALTRWPHKKNEIVTSEITVTESNIEYCDLYDIEYKMTRFVTNDQGQKELRDQYFMAKYIGRTVKVEPMKPTGYNRFTIVPLLHTPRKSSAKARRPMGVPAKVKSSQDLRNVLRSIMLEVVKSSTKHLTIITGASKQEVKDFHKEAAKPMGIVAIENPEARIHTVPDRPLPASIIQFDQINRLSFDENAGDYAPERGQNEGDLSGKAIALLQNKGQLSQFVARENLEAGFEELGELIMETVKTKMTNPFILYDTIDGEEHEIHYNYPVEVLGDQYQPNKYEVVSQNGIINDVNEFPSSGATVKIELDAEGKQAYNEQKAVLSFDKGVLSRKDFTKELYREKWFEIYQNKTLESEALQLVEKIMSGGEEFAQLAAEQIDRLQSILAARGAAAQALNQPNRSLNNA